MYCIQLLSRQTQCVLSIVANEVFNRFLTCTHDPTEHAPGRGGKPAANKLLSPWPPLPVVPQRCPTHPHLQNQSPFLLGRDRWPPQPSPLVGRVPGCQVWARHPAQLRQCGQPVYKCIFHGPCFPGGRPGAVRSPAGGERPCR